MAVGEYRVNWDHFPIATYNDSYLILSGTWLPLLILIPF